MANVWDFNSTWFAMESLDLLLNSLGVTNHFTNEFEVNLNMKFPVGDSFGIRKPQQHRIRRGIQYNPDPMSPEHATVTVQQPFGIDFEWDGIEKALFMGRSREDISKNFMASPMSKIAQSIDSAGAQFAHVWSSNVVGALGTNLTTADTVSGAARQAMVELGCAESGERGLFIPPVVMRSVKNSLAGQFNPVRDISKANRAGIITEMYDSFDWYESMSLYRHTAGTWAGAVTVNGAGQEGYSLNVNCTSGDTWKAGDKISINAVYPVNSMTKVRFNSTARTFTITADVTATAATATLPIYPAIYGINGTVKAQQYATVDTSPSDTAALTLWPGTTSPNGKTGSIGLALQQDAFAVVGVELELPKESSVEMAVRKRDKTSGIAVQFLRMFDGRSLTWINRFDVCLGFGALYSESCSISIASA